MDNDDGFTPEERRALKQVARGVREQWPTRRDALKLGVFGGASALVGAAATDGASGQSESGQIGTEDTPVDDIITNNITDGSSGNSYDIDDLGGGSSGATTVFVSTYGSGTSSIQSALDEYGADPSIVHVDIEVTSVSSALTVPSNTVVVIEEDLELDDSATHNIFENDEFSDESVFDTDIHFIGAGGSLDGNRSGQTSDEDYDQHPVYLNAVRRASIRGLYVTDSNRVGIRVDGSEHVAIRNNTIENTKSRGISLAPSKPNNTNYNRNIIVAGNRLINCTDGVQTGSIVIQAFDSAVAEGNTLVDCEGGIHADTEDDGYDSENVSIAGNSIFGSEDAAGIFIDAREGGHMQMVTISGNVIDTTVGSPSSNSHGILLQAGKNSNSTEKLEHVTVSGNSVKANQIGVFADGTDQAIVEDLIVSNNTIKSDGANGIHLRDAWNAIADGNYIHGCSNDGIDIFGQDTNVEQVSVLNNRSIDNDSIGIRLRGISDSVVMGNTCTDTGSGDQSTGLEEETDCSDIIILLNDLRGNTSTAHSLNGSGTITDAVSQDTTEDWNVT